MAADERAAPVDCPFRFRWRRRQNWEVEAYDARLGRFHVGQITTVEEHGSGRSYWSWSIPVAPVSTAGARGRSETPREAAQCLEAGFSSVVRSARTFSMRAEDEVIFRAVLGLSHTRELDYKLAVQRGEHVRPISPNDKAGWDRWLAEERRRGTRYWISPEEMREWFGDAWQDPRAVKQETMNLPARALSAPPDPASPASSR